MKKYFELLFIFLKNNDIKTVLFLFELILLSCTYSYINAWFLCANFIIIDVIWQFQKKLRNILSLLLILC